MYHRELEPNIYVFCSTWDMLSETITQMNNVGASAAIPLIGLLNEYMTCPVIVRIDSRSGGAR